MSMLWKRNVWQHCKKQGGKDNKTRCYYCCKNTVNATGHKCTFRRNIEQSQIDDVLAKLITAMTKRRKIQGCHSRQNRGNS